MCSLKCDEFWLFYFWPWVLLWISSAQQHTLVITPCLTIMTPMTMTIWRCYKLLKHPSPAHDDRDEGLMNSHNKTQQQWHITDDPTWYFWVFLDLHSYLQDSIFSSIQENLDVTDFQNGQERQSAESALIHLWGFSTREKYAFSLVGLLQSFLHIIPTSNAQFSEYWHYIYITYI